MDTLFGELPDHPAPRVVRGAPRLRQAERHQVAWQTTTLDELIAADHLARTVWRMVEQFDLTPLLDGIEARDNTAGHPQTDPAILVALWLYATLEGVGSARELARLCEAHAAYRWLCGGVSLNHHTLSDFRLAHAAWLDHELARGLFGLLATGEIDLATLAQDGLRVRAAAGSASFRRKPRLHALAEAARARVAQLKQLVASDPAALGQRRRAAQARAAAERLARLEAALAAMPAQEQRKKRNKGDPAQARTSTTDAQARVMKMPDGGFRPAYNVQFCAETRQGLVVAVQVSTSGADQDALVPMHRTVTARFGRVANWLADGGYVSQPGIEHLAAAGTRIYTPPSPLTAIAGSPPLQEWYDRMQTDPAKARYRRRGQIIEWVNAGARNRGLTAVTVRGLEKVRAVALWQALAHNLRCLLRLPAPQPV